jgi:hypothetical protein
MASPRKLVLIYSLALAAIVLLAILPLISVIGAGMVANSAGCQLDEGSVHPCLINGSDYGETLYFFGVLGWLSLVTLPFGAMALLAWLAILLIHIVMRRLKNK